MALAWTVPDTLEMIVGEQLNITIDFANLIAPGDVCSSPQVAVKTQYNESVPSCIIGTPSVNGNSVVQITINSTPLRSQSNYIMVVTCTVSGGGSSKPMSVQMQINVIF